jgi:hypothetical protein
LQRLRTTLVAEHKSTAAIDGEINGRKQGIRVIEQISDPMTAADSSGELVSASSKLPALDAALQGMKENPQLALFRLQSNAYKFAWLLIPISVPFIWLLFAFRRRFGIYDHTIFVTYSLCFMMLLLSTLTLGSQLGVPLVTVGMTLVPPLHIYRQLKGTYALSRLSALWRTVAVTGYAFIALTIFAIALVAIEALE